jgi:Flp pilus assembly protein TadD
MYALALAFWLSLTGQSPVPLDEEPLRVSDEMKQFLDVKIGRGADSLERLQTLVQTVFRDNQLKFSYEPQTRTAADTFSKKSGNCVSFTFLFIAMARQLGLDARFREVDIAPIWTQVGDLVSLSGHVNVAVFIEGRGYSVDLFPQVNRIELGGRVVSDERALAHFYSNRGVEHLAAGRPELAIAYFRKALGSDPTMASAWTNLGVALTRTGDFQEAESSHQRALQTEPGDLVAISNLAALYERVGRTHDAQRYQEKARKLQEKNPYYHFSLGLKSYMAGQYREAVVEYRAALKIRPKEHYFHMALAKAYMRLGEFDKAGPCLKQALKNAPDESSKHRYSEKLDWLLAHQHAAL